MEREREREREKKRVKALGRERAVTGEMVSPCVPLDWMCGVKCFSVVWCGEGPSLSSFIK